MSERRKTFIRSLAPAEPAPKRPKLATVVASRDEHADAEASSSSSSALVSQMVGAKVSVSASSAPLSRRKMFISMLNKEKNVEPKGESDSEPEALQKPAKDAGAVRFTLEGLQAFRSTATGIVSGKTAAEARPARRRRPNYNSSKRRLLAHMPERTKFLAMV